MLVVETTERRVGDEVLPGLEPLVLKPVTTEPVGLATGAVAGNIHERNYRR